MPALRGAGPRADGKPPAATPPTKAPGAIEGSDVAVAACLYSLAFGEAPCVGVVGDRGSGKSTAMKAIARGYLSRSPGLVLALDKGGASGFEGQRRVSLADWAGRPIDAEPRAVVFTGDVVHGVEPDPEEIARQQWRLVGSRVKSLLLVDEMKWIARGGWWRKGVKWVPQTCTEGRKHHAGIVWGSQTPQDAPREAFEESGVLVTFRLSGLSLNRLDERGYLRGIDPQVVEELPGDDSPPPDRGRCVILRRGRPWDGKFYRFG